MCEETAPVCICDVCGGKREKVWVREERQIKGISLLYYNNFVVDTCNSECQACEGGLSLM